jgi:hypothetical protein
MRPRFDIVQLSGNISALFSILDTLDPYILKRGGIGRGKPTRLERQAHANAIGEAET